MRLLVTGGAGFIGSHVADHALAQGWTVGILDDLSGGRRDNIPDGVEMFPADIRSRDSVWKAFRAFKPEVVSHQAAQASVAISVREPVKDAQINILGSLNLLDASVEFKVSRFLFASTGGAIYGEVPAGQATEETLPLPVSPYAASKFAVENYLRCYEKEHGLKSVVLRYANVYGPRQDPHGEAGVVAIFMNRLLSGEPLRINAMRTPGDDGCIRDYVHVSDVARANIAAAQGNFPFGVVNICTGHGITTRHLAETLQKVSGHSGELTFGAKRPGDTERSVLSPTRFHRVFGEPKDLESGLRDTADWFRKTKTGKRSGSSAGG